jgi:hypothetical protein
VRAPQNQNVVQSKYVQQLMILNVKRWDANKIHSLFSGDVAQEILDVHSLEEVDNDKLI